MSRRMMTRPQVNKRGSLPAGVYCYLKPRALRSGEEVDYLYFSTHTVENGRRVVKSFSCGRWPVSKAPFKARKAEAIAYRRAWEARVHAEALGLGRVA